MKREIERIANEIKLYIFLEISKDREYCIDFKFQEIIGFLLFIKNKFVDYLQREVEMVTSASCEKQRWPLVRAGRASPWALSHDQTVKFTI